VLRGPRGFGKTTAICTWLEAGGQGTDVAYYAMRAGEGTSGQFWAGLRELLGEAEVLTGPDGPDDESVVGASLARLAEPFILVLAGYEQAGSLDDDAGNADGEADLDSRLIELLRASPRLDLVVATRELRSLEIHAPLAIDTTLLRPTDLALDAGGVLALAEQRGLTIDAASA